MQINLKRSAYSEKFKDLFSCKKRIVCLFGGRGCFGENQNIETINGYKPISDIQNGDLVKSFNEKSKKIEFKEVVNVFKYKNADKCIRFIYDNKEIICTLDHKFYYKGKFVEIQKILKENGINI